MHSFICCDIVANPGVDLNKNIGCICRDHCKNSNNNLTLRLLPFVYEFNVSRFNGRVAGICLLWDDIAVFIARSFSDWCKCVLSVLVSVFYYFCFETETECNVVALKLSNRFAWPLFASVFLLLERCVFYRTIFRRQRCCSAVAVFYWAAPAAVNRFLICINGVSVQSFSFVWRSHFVCNLIDETEIVFTRVLIESPVCCKVIVTIFNAIKILFRSIFGLNTAHKIKQIDTIYVMSIDIIAAHLVGWRFFLCMESDIYTWTNSTV